MGSPLVVLSRSELEGILDFDSVREGVEQAFIAIAHGEARLFPLVREALPNDSMFGLRSCLWEARGLLGLKLSGYYAGNRRLGRDSHQACVLLVDPTDGSVRAMLDGNHVTWVRTAVAGAVGTLALARSDARSVLIVGNGLQAEAQARSHAWILRDRDPRFTVHAPRDTDGSTTRQFVDRLHAHGIAATATSDLASGVARADIVVTATPSRTPLIREDWVALGTHITAMGSDAPGKIELDPHLTRSARLVVDDVAQARRVGEAQSRDSDTDITALGLVIAGAAPGRTSDDEVTVFDSTGLAIHDVVTADTAVRAAEAAGLGSRTLLD